MRPFLPALALLALGSSALAGPKPPASPVFEPEIGYTYASGNYMDLRLANRVGDKAILVHRTGFGALGSFDLSDEATRRIAYTDGGKLYVRIWETGTAVAVSGPDPVYEGPKLVEAMDFSPKGDRLAFTVLSAAGDEILVSDFAAPPNRCLPATRSSRFAGTPIRLAECFTSPVTPADLPPLRWASTSWSPDPCPSGCSRRRAAWWISTCRVPRCH
ncbi:MAG: hypothetical protein Q8R44_14085 [Novosphingobium sp.]|nr:hypothetical protein [Novosphingobium sp.]